MYRQSQGVPIPPKFPRQFPRQCPPPFRSRGTVYEGDRAALESHLAIPFRGDRKVSSFKPNFRVLIELMYTLDIPYIKGVYLYIVILSPAFKDIDSSGSWFSI